MGRLFSFKGIDVSKSFFKPVSGVPVTFLKRIFAIITIYSIKSYSKMIILENNLKKIRVFKAQNY